jgi:hypothetical protein
VIINEIEVLKINFLMQILNLIAYPYNKVSSEFGVFAFVNAIY